MQMDFKVRAFGSAPALHNATGAACQYAPENHMFRPFALVGCFLKFRSNFNQMIMHHLIEVEYVFRFQFRAQSGHNKRKENDET